MGSSGGLRVQLNHRIDSIFCRLQKCRETNLGPRDLLDKEGTAQKIKKLNKVLDCFWHHCVSISGNENWYFLTLTSELELRAVKHEGLCRFDIEMRES